MVHVVREDTIPAVGGVPAIRIVTWSNGSVMLEQGDETISLHAYQAAEIAGFLWPAGSKPNFEEDGAAGQAKRKLQ